MSDLQSYILALLAAISAQLAFTLTVTGLVEDPNSQVPVAGIFVNLAVYWSLRAIR